MPDKHLTLHAMLQAAAVRAEQVLADFTPQAVANLMWAFAALSHNPGVLLQYVQRMYCLSQLTSPLQHAASAEGCREHSDDCPPYNAET